MTLDGIEEIISKNAKRGQKVNYVRYCDDFIVTGKSKEILVEVKKLIEEFLKLRGLELSKEKTKIVSIQEGFDFLGQNIRKYNGKLLIKPSKKNIKKMREKLKELFKRHRTATAAHFIDQLNPIMRGWANYHRNAVSKETFGLMDNWIYQHLREWAKRRHPMKNSSWIQKKYFCRSSEEGSYFFGIRENGEKVYLCQASSTVIRRHIKIRNHCNPYDPADEPYLEQRLMNKWMRSNQYGILKTLWLRQKGKCPQCGTKITQETQWNIHHVTPRCKGGKETLDNLMLLHPNCHRQLHATNSALTTGLTQVGLINA